MPSTFHDHVILDGFLGPEDDLESRTVTTGKCESWEKSTFRPLSERKLSSGPGWCLLVDICSSSRQTLCVWSLWGRTNFRLITASVTAERGRWTVRLCDSMAPDHTAVALADLTPASTAWSQRSESRKLFQIFQVKNNQSIWWRAIKYLPSA